MIAKQHKLLGRVECPSVLVPACPCLPPSVPVYLFLSPSLSLFTLSETLSLPYIFFMLKDNTHTEKRPDHENSAQGILVNSNQHPRSPLLVPASLQGQPHPYLLTAQTHLPVSTLYMSGITWLFSTDILLIRPVHIVRSCKLPIPVAGTVALSAYTTVY